MIIAAGISGEMVRDLLVTGVKRRFGTTRVPPRTVEWLPDNGRVYTAKDTARALGSTLLSTAVRSPK
ncbi:hypothetical protein ACE100_07215 [Methylobacterium sp. MA0201]